MITISVHVVVTQNMIARSLKPIPDIQEFLILGNWNTEVSQLNDEIGLPFLHPFDEYSQPVICVVDDVLMDIGHQTETDDTILVLHRFSFGESGELGDEERTAHDSAVLQESSARDEGVFHRVMLRAVVSSLGLSCLIPEHPKERKDNDF
jgi:hypothetical protein